MQAALEYWTNRDLFSPHYLRKLLPDTDDWNDVNDDVIRNQLESIVDVFEGQRANVAQYDEAELEKEVIRPVLDALGHTYAVQQKVERVRRFPDYGFFYDEDAKDEAFGRLDMDEGDFYRDALAVGDAKRWDRPLDKRGTDRHDFSNPSHQIHVYLQETPTEWAILTNGRKWRLYYAGTSHKLDSYYEVDLPTLLDRTAESEDGLEAFRYFSLFFRRDAFVEDAAGQSFLDRVYEQSNVFAQELGEDLQDNIYKAIRVLAEGFLNYDENDLDPIEDLQLIHDSALVYLYRLIFVFYAESPERDLLDTRNRIYRRDYSLTTLKERIRDTIEGDGPGYTSFQTKLWDRLNDLFALIDQGSEAQGIPSDKLYVPAYNGGLFRTEGLGEASEEAQFLQEYEVADEHLASVIDLLARRESTNGAGKVFVDYSTLDIRDLGSIYEGLLEYQLEVADEPLGLNEGAYVPVSGEEDTVVGAGDVYLRTDRGERKATGSYYTPEYVVEYIVENTLGPLVGEIREDLIAQDQWGKGDTNVADEFAERVFSLKILDPAMGSGHFLTNAIDYLAREIIDAQAKQAEEVGRDTIDESHDIHWARRQVAQKCIYGVDLNSMATELAKVSLWLRTLAAEQPLAFLDHHLKTGNSLVGADIEDIKELELQNGQRDDDDSVMDEEGRQSALMEFDEKQRHAIEELMDLYREFIAIENQELADAKEMERRHREIEQDERRRQLVTMANVYTADQFGLDVPDDAYKRMARVLNGNGGDWSEVNGTEWYEQAQQMATDRSFFHWKLQFPEVFYNTKGEEKANPGFDAVIGNPPYVRIYRGALDESNVEYWRDTFNSAHMKFDLYVLFMELSIDLTNEGGFFSMIVPDKFMNTPYGEPLRELILDSTDVQSILDLRHLDVFKGVTVSNVIPVLRVQEKEMVEFPVLRFEDGEVLEYNRLSNDAIISNADRSFRLTQREEDLRLKEKIEKRSIRFDDVYYVNWGLRTGTAAKTEKYVVESPRGNESYPMIRGESIEKRYRLVPPEEYIIYEKSDLYNPMFEELFESTKIVFRKISGEGLMAVVDENEYYCFSTLIPCVNILDVENVERKGIPEPTKECRKYSDPYFALAVVNSKLLTWYYMKNLSDELSVVPNHIKELPLPEIDFSSPEEDIEVPRKEGNRLIENARSSGRVGDLLDFLDEQLRKSRGDVVYSVLATLGNQMMELNSQRGSIQLDLPAYLGNYDVGKLLPDCGLYQPAEDVQESILSKTTDTHSNLRVAEVQVDRRDANSFALSAVCRYKPEYPEEHDTDSHGYTRTDPISAMEFTDLTETEADLIEAFAPVAVERELGDFRKNATKTISPLDRLKALRLPDPDDVAADLDRYLDATARAEELDEKIKRTDDVIDRIVYRLYGLTDEEIAVVEAAVDS